MHSSIASLEEITRCPSFHMLMEERTRAQLNNILGKKKHVSFAAAIRGLVEREHAALFGSGDPWQLIEAEEQLPKVEPVEQLPEVDPVEQLGNELVQMKDGEDLPISIQQKTQEEALCELLSGDELEQLEEKATSFICEPEEPRFVAVVLLTARLLVYLCSVVGYKATNAAYQEISGRGAWFTIPAELWRRLYHALQLREDLREPPAPHPKT